MLDEAKVEDLINPGSSEDKLNAVYLPEAPREVIRFFNFMQNHITLESNGMGVGLRENRHNIAELMKKNGYDYPIYESFIDDFEDKLLSQHYENKDKDK